MRKSEDATSRYPDQENCGSGRIKRLGVLDEGKCGTEEREIAIYGDQGTRIRITADLEG
jgi:hypothetical protein